MSAGVCPERAKSIFVILTLLNYKCVCLIDFIRHLFSRVFSIFIFLYCGMCKLCIVKIALFFFSDSSVRCKIHCVYEAVTVFECYDRLSQFECLEHPCQLTRCPWKRCFILKTPFLNHFSNLNDLYSDHFYPRVNFILPRYVFNVKIKYHLSLWIKQCVEYQCVSCCCNSVWMWKPL